MKRVRNHLVARTCKRRPTNPAAKPSEMSKAPPKKTSIIDHTGAARIEKKMTRPGNSEYSRLQYPSVCAKYLAAFPSRGSGKN
jgi:hypothetical protein